MRRDLNLQRQVVTKSDNYPLTLDAYESVLSPRKQRRHSQLSYVYALCPYCRGGASMAGLYTREQRSTAPAIAWIAPPRSRAMRSALSGHGTL